MAQLLGKHPLDCVRLCPTCYRLRDARYQGAWILRMPDRKIVEARMYTCTACGDVFAADHICLENASSKRLLEITDRRAWHWLREEANAALFSLVELEAS